MTMPVESIPCCTRYRTTPARVLRSVLADAPQAPLTRAAAATDANSSTRPRLNVLPFPLRMWWLRPRTLEPCEKLSKQLAEQFPRVQARLSGGALTGPKRERGRGATRAWPAVGLAPAGQGLPAASRRRGLPDGPRLSWPGRGAPPARSRAR